MAAAIVIESRSCPQRARPRTRICLARVTRTRAATLIVKAKPTLKALGWARLSAMIAWSVRASPESRTVLLAEAVEEELLAAGGPLGFARLGPPADELP